MSYLSRYKKRVLLKGKNDKEREEYLGKRNFKYMLNKKTSPTVHTVLLDLNIQNSDIMETIEIDCEISNVTNNDQSKYDEKYINFEIDKEVTYGSYISWKNSKWLILFEENNSFGIYRTFVMRRCNNIFKFKYKGIIYEIPQVVKNLTLYSDGLDEEIYISKPDAQRQILMCDNELTAKITVGTRVMLTGSTVYMITHIDDFSNIGVRAMICKQTTLHSLDDVVNNIAYNENSELNLDIPTSLCIEGESIVYLGDTVKYEINNVALDLKEKKYFWKLSNKDIGNIVFSSNNHCEILLTDKVEFVNKKFDLELYSLNDNSLITKKSITIRGLI